MGPMEFAREHKKGVAVATTAALLAGAASLAAVRYDGGETAGGPTTEDELRDLLTVDTTSVDCEAVVQETGIGEVKQAESGPVVIFDVGATKQVEFGNPDARWWSDGLSTPFKTPETDSAGLLKELQATICEDPELGSTFANMFANMEVEGVKVVDLNPWLAEYAGDPSIINDKAGESMPLRDRSAESISDEELDNAVKENQEYQVVAEKLGTLLTRFQNAGVTEMGPTTFNYNLVAGGLVAGGLPEVGLNATQFETAKGVTFVLTKKDGECLVTLMVNIGDKRPEGVENEVCETPEVPVETTVPGDTTPATGGPEETTTTRYGVVTTTIPGVTTTVGGTTTIVVPPKNGETTPDDVNTPPTVGPPVTGPPTPTVTTPEVETTLPPNTTPETPTTPPSTKPEIR